MPSNVARALSATPITRARSNESSYWNVTLTPITAPPVACPRRDATDRCDLSPSGGHGQARPGGQRAIEIRDSGPFQIRRHTAVSKLRIRDAYRYDERSDLDSRSFGWPEGGASMAWPSSPSSAARVISPRD